MPVTPPSPTSATISPKPAKAVGPATVDTYLESLDPAVRKLVQEVRTAILAADSRISEGIKWKVASFRTKEYFATVNLRVPEGVGLILHFGAKVSSIATTGVDIPDRASLLHWLGKDRATVTFRDAAQFKRERVAFMKLVREWIRHV